MTEAEAIRQIEQWAVKRQEAFIQKQLYQQRKIKILTSSRNKCEALKLKDRIRKREAVTEATSTTPAKITSPSEYSYISKQSLGKADACIIRMLPKTPGKKKHVLSKIVSIFPPCSKMQYNSILGWLEISSELRETIISFFEKPDISYCKPCKKRHGLYWQRWKWRKPVSTTSLHVMDFQRDSLNV